MRRGAWCVVWASAAVPGLAGQTVLRSTSDCSTDETGTPLYGQVRATDSVSTLAYAFVRLERYRDTTFVVTDHRGVYLACGLAPGPIRLSGHLGGYSSPPTDLSLPDDAPTRADLVIDFTGPPAAWTRPDRAVPPGSLRGAVRDPDAGPIPGATLSLVATGWQALTDADGRFVFGEVLAGPHVLRIDHLASTPPSAPWRSSWIRSS